MENTSTIALSRQGPLRRSMSIIANNLANMNTTGFKGSTMMFTQHVQRSRGGEGVFGDKVAYVRDVSSVRYLNEGPLEKTGNPFDVSIHGKGYLRIDAPGGERFTRNGQLRLDAGGQIVTHQGYPVLSDAGTPFVLAPGDGTPTIARDGTISTANGILGRLAVVEFENDYRMNPVAGGLLSTTQTPRQTETPDVVQGMLEGSNVEPIIEMARMIEVHRAYNSVSKLIDREDDRQQKMITELAKPT